MEVGAANAGAVHPDEDVVDADLRDGHFLEPQAWLSLPLDKRFHGLVLHSK
jgi:hypothetical protein